jgi:Fic family protein
MPTTLPPGYRTTPATLVKPAADAFAPRFTLDTEVHETIRAIERADQDLARFEIDEATAHRMLRDALTRNAYGTASIEGNPLTLDQVQSLLADEKPAAEHVPDEREILNQAAAMRHLDELDVPTTVHDVARFHAILFKDVLTDAGRIKTEANFIGRASDRTVVFVPTPPERVDDELARALAWLHQAPQPPLVRAAVFFHEFQGIHPFRDGNGRVGRFLFHLILHRWGYPGARYALIDYAFNADRDAYYEALSDTERADWDFTPWIRYLLAVLRRTYEEAVQRFLFARRIPQGLNDRQVRLAEWIARIAFTDPARRVKIGDAAARYPHVPRRTLQHDLAKLRAAGLVVAEGEGKATRYRAPRARV